MLCPLTRTNFSRQGKKPDEPKARGTTINRADSGIGYAVSGIPTPISANTIPTTQAR